jgi:hypothetical protein
MLTVIYDLPMIVKMIDDYGFVYLPAMSDCVIKK